MGPWELTSMEVPKVARQRFLDDVTETVGQVFLAHALQCARCHDHKFDPVPTRDYYSIQAVFATTQFAERPAAFRPAENTSGFEEKRYLEAHKARCAEQTKIIEAKKEVAARAWFAARGLPYITRAEARKKNIPEDRLPSMHIGLDAHDITLQRNIGKELSLLKWEFERYEPIAFSVYSGRTPRFETVSAPLRIPARPLTDGDLETTCILAGGDAFSPKDPVTPGILSAVAGITHASESTNLSGRIPATIEGRRRALADWIASPQNPLTPRVMVNRLWLWHFGRAIAGNPNNFGATGKKPTHPDLLDWLASEFVARGWSSKAMHRLIMTSAAYRRSSLHSDPQKVASRDPEQTSYATFPPRRLAAEELRDAMLAVSGELNPALGGIPVSPEIPWEVAIQPRQVMGSFAPAWQPSPRPGQRHRRSIYTLKLRSFRDPFFEVFNQPSSETSCEIRETSTITPQALTLLNSNAARGRSLAFAAKLLRESTEPPQAIDLAFRRALGRSPTESESRACLTLWDEMTARHQALSFKPKRLPKSIDRVVIDDATGERVTLQEVFDKAADFQPDLQPSDCDPRTRGLMEVCLVLFNLNEFVSLD
jgi:hypothetical protein